MKLKFIGADHEVTGSCHYLEACGRHLLVDYGMEQGRNVFENVPLPVNAALIDAVFLTHAHIDHSGLLPLLYANGFRGKIYATEATTDLCGIMLRDSAHIQMQEAEWRSRKGARNKSIAQITPLYTMEDADNTMKCFVPCAYNEEIPVEEGIRIRFTDIGHLLGSASIEVWLTEGAVEKKLVFSGDIGNVDQPLIKDPLPTKAADYVIMESTYGDRLHTAYRPDYVRGLATVFQETFKRGGNVVIPSFAVGRTQEILYFIRKIKQEGLVKEEADFPVYVDSPLAVDATEIFNEHVYDCFDEEALEIVGRGENPISFPGLRLAITPDESRAINFDPRPKVILSASGMCDAGRIKHHLKHNLWRPECTILFVGYQAVGTPGRSLVDGADHIKLFGETVDVRARIEKLEGLSGHADKNGLIRWVSAFEEKPAKVFVVHGEDVVAKSFTECLQKEYRLDAYAPYSGTEFDLARGEFIYEAPPVPVKKAESLTGIPGADPASAKGTERYPAIGSSAGRTADRSVFARLLAAGERLLAVISKNKGLSNKDLGKFADQIHALADKWDR